MITAGFIDGPQGSPTARAIQFDPTQSQGSASVVLLTKYWPVAYEYAAGYGRASFLTGVPLMVPAGTSLTLAQGEAAALCSIGAARGA